MLYVISFDNISGKNFKDVTGDIQTKNREIRSQLPLMVSGVPMTPKYRIYTGETGRNFVMPSPQLTIHFKT